MADYGWSLQEDLPTPTYGQGGIEVSVESLLRAAAAASGRGDAGATTQSIAGDGGGGGTADNSVGGGGTSTTFDTSSGSGSGSGSGQQTATNPNLTAALGGMLNADNPVGADIWLGGGNFNTDGGINGNGLYNTFYDWSLMNHLTGLSPDLGASGAGGRGGGGGGGGNRGGASNYYYRPQDKMYHVYNPTSNQWETYSVDDLLNGHLSENMKKQHDDAWYRDNAFNLDQQHYSDVYNDALSAQRQGAADNYRVKYQQQYY